MIEGNDDEPLVVVAQRQEIFILHGFGDPHMLGECIPPLFRPPINVLFVPLKLLLVLAEICDGRIHCRFDFLLKRGSVRLHRVVFLIRILSEQCGCDLSKKRLFGGLIILTQSIIPYE